MAANPFGANSVFGGIKSCHRVAQNQATLDLGMTRTTRRRPVNCAPQIAGGLLAALARLGQDSAGWLRQFWWTCGRGFAPGGSFRRSS